MDNPSKAQQSQHSTPPAELPPLRIHHLMACAAVTAMQLTYWRLTLPPGALQQLSSVGNIPAAVIFTLGQIASAAGMTFAILSVFWHFKGYPALAQPGQWLLLSHLIYALRLMWGWLYGPILRGLALPWSKNVLLWEPSDILRLFVQLTAILIYVAPALLFAWCAWKIAKTAAWRVLLAVVAMGYLLSIVPLSSILITRFGIQQEIAFAVDLIGGNPVRLLLVLWVAADDWHRRRVWTHWLGLGLFGASQLLGLAGGVLFWLGWY